MHRRRRKQHEEPNSSTLMSRCCAGLKQLKLIVVSVFIKMYKRCYFKYDVGAHKPDSTNVPVPPCRGRCARQRADRTRSRSPRRSSASRWCGWRPSPWPSGPLPATRARVWIVHETARRMSTVWWYVPNLTCQDLSLMHHSISSICIIYYELILRIIYAQRWICTGASWKRYFFLIQFKSWNLYIF